MTEIINDIKVFKPNYRDTAKAHIPNMTAYKKIYDNLLKTPMASGLNKPNDWIGSKNGTPFQITISPKQKLNGLKGAS